ncbi:putative PEP-CTERM system histidine kinase [Paucibacter oligotrophus]|uniref:histidine kinase n=1 Tax=Roseateles oligotrophus TaxID=1769250 RepID=A0A840LFN8_9BURK|nr:XrtA/PEP-CTERM system histidine kinase PrsK [Roseateles oligotrophus]MBB4844117.1 putative PEP-CTERM system histidine kinase [Roseateles oligotrophus]
MIQSRMLNGLLDLGLIGDLLAVIAYAGFALSFGSCIWWKKSAAANPVSFVFIAALICSAVWAGLSLAGQQSRSPFWLDQWAIPLADWARYSLWFLFLLLLLQPAGTRPERAKSFQFLPLLLLCLSLALLLIIGRGLDRSWSSELVRPAAFAALALAVVGLLLVEQLLRNATEDARWNAKPACLGLGTIFVFDIFVFSQAVLFGEFDGDALSVRAAVHASAVPLLFVASRRHVDWLDKLHVSRAAVFHSASLLLVGAYLLLVSAVGYYVRYTGGEWGRALQLALVSCALLGLALLVLSGSLRSQLKVYIAKNFFNYRYDYREEWLRFTATLSSSGAPQEVGETVVKALANLVESPAGALWLQRGPAGAIVQTARWNLPPQTASESAHSPFCEFLRERAWIVDLDQARKSLPEYEALATPNWLMADAKYWLLIPLLVGQDLIGFVLLGRARANVEVNWEVRDLLKTASRQASSYLAQMQAAEALLEAKKFDAFNRMSAFVVHDLKNIVTQLSLMMKNAKRLRDNPEFQQDMLDTVENSLEKMRQLMLQLREGDKPHGVVSGVDLEQILKRLAQSVAAKGRKLDLQLSSGVSTRGHDERIERVLGHVVQNALDATPVSGEVRIALDKTGSQARVRVRDDGCGMSEEFVQNKLFKPFQTTKETGMGIGAYESYQYLQELGGKIEVESKLGQGTLVTILLPLFHASSTSSMIEPLAQ